VATIAKFYLRDTATSNTGTMPSGVLLAGGSFTATDGDATGARTARTATDVAGTANPDTESLITAVANTTAQRWGHRRFVSAPLAAHTFATADGNWTFSYAATESNTSHNGFGMLSVYAWDPTGGVRRGSGNQLANPSAAMTATVETAYSNAVAWGTTLTTNDGDILVFDVVDSFTQGMSVAYTSSFAYDGTTEASTTTCASFVTPPAALTLFTASTAIPDVYTARTRS
jgi:hypothetical protein